MIIEPCEWINKPDGNGNGFLLGYAVGGTIEFPIPIETHCVSVSNVTMNEEHDFEIILECAEKPQVYDDEEIFRQSKEHGSMAAESVIPIGTFSPKDNNNFAQTTTILMNAKVVKTYSDPLEYGFEKGDMLFSLSCQDYEFDAVMPGTFADGVDIKVGNIVSCVYWVQGWPKEE